MLTRPVAEVSGDVAKDGGLVPLPSLGALADGHVELPELLRGIGVVADLALRPRGIALPA